MAGNGRSSEANSFCAECGSISVSKRAWARMILADAAQEKQEGIQDQCGNNNLLSRKQVKRSAETDCNAHITRRAYNARQLGNGESFKEECRKQGKLCEWTLERLRPTTRLPWKKLAP